MAEKKVRLALFNEDQIDHAAEALSRLRGMGVSEDDITVISGVPYSERVLGRPIRWTRIVQVGMVGAVLGFLVAAFLNWGTPFLYPLKVGRLPVYPIPTSIVVIFELTMLGLLISTFLGVFAETITPSFGPRGYHPRVTDGRIGILYASPFEKDGAIEQNLRDLGAEFEEVQKQ